MYLMLAIIWIHFIADFLLQSRAIATGKSTYNSYLAAHVALYSMPFLLFGWKFAVITYVTHFCTDWLTSRGTTYFYKREKYYEFFALIGFDQAIHLTTLILTAEYLLR